MRVYRWNQVLDVAGRRGRDLLRRAGYSMQPVVKAPDKQDDSKVTMTTVETVAKAAVVEAVASMPGGPIDPSGSQISSAVQKYMQDHADELKGTKGDPGFDGVRGEEGPRGISGLSGADGSRGEQGPKGADGSTGVDGKSAYQLARDAGYGGTQTQWLASLKGADGATGPAGPAGASVQIQRKSVATPALILLGTSDLTVTWDTAFKQSVVDGVTVAAAAYEVFVEMSGGALGKLDYTIKSQTATQVVITVAAVLAAGAGTMKVRGIHP